MNIMLVSSDERIRRSVAPRPGRPQRHIGFSSSPKFFLADYVVAEGPPACCSPTSSQPQSAPCL